MKFPKKWATALVILSTLLAFLYLLALALTNTAATP